jgi:hypothetical protein
MYSAEICGSLRNINRFKMSGKVSEKDFGFIESVSSFKGNLLNPKNF